MFFSIIKAITRLFVLQESKLKVSCFALYCCALKTAILLLSSEVSGRKGRHFEMFLATHGYESMVKFKHRLV